MICFFFSMIETRVIYMRRKLRTIQLVAEINGKQSYVPFGVNLLAINWTCTIESQNRMINAIANSVQRSRIVQVVWSVYEFCCAHLFIHTYANLPNHLNWDKLWCWVSIEQNIKCALAALKIESSCCHPKWNTKNKKTRTIFDCSIVLFI